MTISRVISIVIPVACVVWFLLAVYVGWLGWPRIPLDVPASDPEIIAEHQKAIATHVATYAVAGLWPTAIVLIVRWLKRRSG